MPEMTERIGKYDVRVAFRASAQDEDCRQRRIDALAAWLLARWGGRLEEVEDGDARAAG
jgi:hypothetical protein